MRAAEDLKLFDELMKATSEFLFPQKNRFLEMLFSTKNSELSYEQSRLKQIQLSEVNVEMKLKALLDLLKYIADHHPHSVEFLEKLVGSYEEIEHTDTSKPIIDEKKGILPLTRDQRVMFTHEGQYSEFGTSYTVNTMQHKNTVVAWISAWESSHPGVESLPEIGIVFHVTPGNSTGH